MTSKTVTRTTKVLTRQILAFRKKAADNRLSAKKRWYYRIEQKLLRQRLMAIIRADSDYDPLIDDIDLGEIGITGEGPELTDADQMIALKALDDEDGRPRVRTAPGWRSRKNAIKELSSVPG